jgi:hypothetical protein
MTYSQIYLDRTKGANQKGFLMIFQCSTTSQAIVPCNGEKMKGIFFVTLLVPRNYVSITGRAPWGTYMSFAYIFFYIPNKSRIRLNDIRLGKDQLSFEKCIICNVQPVRDDNCGSFVAMTST